MEIIRIKNIEEELFQKIWPLYRISFPEFEQRNISDMQKALTHSGFVCEVFLDEEKQPLGFLMYWEFDNFIYIEYFAVFPEKRGGGTGSKVLKDFLSRAKKPVILDIDPVCDQITSRRLGFYKRHGMVENKHIIHNHSPYQRGGEPFVLELISYPNQVSPAEYEKFIKIHRQIIVGLNFCFLFFNKFFILIRP